MKKIIVVFLMLALMLSITGCSLMGITFSLRKQKEITTENEVKPVEVEPVVKHQFAEMDTIEETVIFDSPVARVTVLGNHYNEGFSEGSIELSLLYENFSDNELFFGTEILSVNNYTMPQYSIFGSARVSANDKETTTTRVYTEDLLRVGIRNISDIEIECTIDVVDDSIFGSDTLVEERKHFTFETNYNDGMGDNCFVASLKDGSYEALTEQKIDFLSENEIFYEDGLRIIAAALTTDDRLLLEFENTTNEDIYFSLENFTVNGILLNNFPANSPYESETIVANTHLIIETAIMPPKLVKDCFSIASIADVTFSVDIDWSVMKNSASISIPSRDAAIDTSGIQVCKYENINITYKGLYCTKTSEYNIDENPYDVYYEDDDNYELLLYVENGNPEEILIELEALFLDYEKIDFSTYETYGRDNRYWNFGTVPAGYCGYIKLKLDTKSMQDNYMCDISSISEIEMKILFKESLSEDILASEWVSFSVS